MDRPWTVELSTRAADHVRSLPPIARDHVGRLLDELSSGIPSQATQDSEGESWTWAPKSGPFVLRFLVDTDRRGLLVFGIVGAEADAPRPNRSSAWERASTWGSDLRAATRSLRRAPTFTLGVVLTLALGIGGASTIFGLVHTVFRGPLPFEDGDRVVRIRSRSVGTNGEDRLFNVTPRDFALAREANRSFEWVVAQSGRSVSLLGEGPAQRASVIGVSAGWLELLGVQPAYGRGFTADEEALGNEAGVALLSHALWEQRFGADPTLVGSDVRYDGGTFRVVGVMPPRFAYPYDADLWVPWREDPANWTASSLNVIARLSTGASVDGAQADLDQVYAELKSTSPGVAPNEGFSVQTARTDFIRTQAASLQSLAIAVLFLLLLVCVNVANLFVARSAARRQEIAVRAALGAGRARQLRSVLMESLVVFSVGGALGLLLVRPLGAAASVLIPDVLRTQLDVQAGDVGWAILAFTGAIVVFGGLLTGVLGARSGRRTDLSDVLRTAGRGSMGGSGAVRDGLIVAELSLSLVLLMGAGVLADHFRRLESAALGFDTEAIVTAQLSLQHERYETPDARVGLYDVLRERLSGSQGAEAVGLTSVNPLCCGDWGARIRVEGVDRPPEAPPVTVHHRYVSRHYFEAMGIPIVDGRAFDVTDGPDTPDAVIIDEDLAARFWPGESALGHRVALERDGAPWRTIVGVAARAHAEGDPRETWYLPFEQDPMGASNEVVHLMIRGPGVSGSDVREAVAQVDPSLAVFGFATLEAQRDERLAQDRVGAVVALTFAVAGLLLAAIGLYGLLAYRVELQRRELGMRVALGATRPVIGLWVLGRTGRLVGAGLLLGLVLAVPVMQWVVRTVQGAQPASAGLVAMQCAVLAITALIAMAVPTLRALATDPAGVLKGD